LSLLDTVAKELALQAEVAVATQVEVAVVAIPVEEVVAVLQEEEATSHLA
jgi:hypothetical protein